MFYKIIHEAINKFIPKFNNVNSTFPIWYSNKLKNTICENKKYHKLYKQTNNHQYFNIFSRLRALCKLETKSNYTSYMNKIQLNFLHNSKLFLNYIKSLKNDNDFPAIMELNNISGTNGHEQ